MKESATNKSIETFAKYAGLVTVCSEWLALTLFFILKPGAFNGENPISYFASYPETHVFFSVCLTIAAVSFWVFAKYHLPKYYAVPEGIFTASMIGYALLALVPFNPADPASDLVHRLLALFFSVTYQAGITIMGRRSHDPQVKYVSYATAGLCALIMIAFLSLPQTSRLLLPLEAASALFGQLWVVWISFHSFRK